MEQFFAHLLHTAIWVFGIIIILAIIGFFSIIGWIIGLFRKGEQEVGAGVKRVEDMAHRQ